ncbi:Transcriptional regulator [Elusimicrobium minutum Pei191]|uniref:Transcriptional regulator n=1 Tax=Elusimicrobium minutum (strain Pei191) TaxID=445932 RepID=B2KCR6_ELUMP|nr:LysR family transcriptional regulator [Elusimicrobium minutum]ACC98312.1 Transcriptional regulator [Elusimicrobium minutum Pei191]
MINLLHLKYVLEVEKTSSISKAAANMYMGQPNLSRAIKELEKILGITIFKRTSKGISPTPRGEEFLQYAKKIISQVEEVTAMYKSSKTEKQSFSISVPRASYISHAFTEFAKNIDLSLTAEFYYKETNSMRAISNILQADYRLGIIRYQAAFEEYFKVMLYEKQLAFEPVRQFSYVLLMSKDNPLAKKTDIKADDLKNFIEIAHADPYVPSLPVIDVKKAELSTFVNKRIYVFERASQFELLNKIKKTFMWVSPVPEEQLKRYNLVQKKCSINKKIYKDILIYRKNYRFTPLDEKFIKELNKAKLLK